MISLSVLSRTRTAAEEIVQKIKKNTFCVQFPPPLSPLPQNRTFYEIMWKNIVMPNREQMTIRRMRTSRWIPKATDTHSEYVILTAFFFTTVMAALTRLNVTSYVQCLSFVLR